MGALHQGHGDLIDRARDLASVVVVSIFVNPLQFGPAEDLESYPRDLDSDVAVCAEHGAELVFAPVVDEMYPAGQPNVTVDPGELGLILEGASRPAHFRGVLTVVAKLFAVVRPHLAVLGAKDYQQLVLVRRMVSDLSMDVDVVDVAIRREPDGLAMSSRNRYLTVGQRTAALALSRALRRGAVAADRGPQAVLTAAAQPLSSEPELTLDYLALRTVDLTEDAVHGEARLLVAASAGGTRLIDNAPLVLP
jgi:pantoate--beta-alanine ligase